MVAVWLNGAFLDDPTEARLSVFDASVQHGVGLFETMRAHNGRLFRPGPHIDRLIDSAKTLRLTERLRRAPLAEAAQHVVDKAGLDRARVRLTVTGGNLNMIASRTSESQDPTILIVAEPATEYPQEMFEQGVVCALSNAGRNPFDLMAGHKTINYWPSIMALAEANARGGSEAIWLTALGHLADGSVSNVFLVREGMLHTPLARGETDPGAVPSPVLPGITRAAIFELAADAHLEIERKMLSLEDLHAAEEVFLTNSSWGVLPVVRVEDKQIGEGTVGEVTRSLRAAWLQMIEDETSA